MMEEMQENSPPGAPPAIPKPPKTYYCKNSRGLIELRDLQTGRLLCVQTTARDLMSDKFERLTRIETPEGPVFIERGINYDMVAKIDRDPYSKLLGDLLCERIFHGDTLAQACQEIGVKYSAVVRWKREHSEFAEALREAKIDRAERHHDMAIEISQESFDTKLKVETMKWAAEKGDPEKFGSRTKVVGDRENPVAFVFNTGIDRTQGQKEEAKNDEIVVEAEQEEKVEYKAMPE